MATTAVANKSFASENIPGWKYLKPFVVGGTGMYLSSTEIEALDCGIFSGLFLINLTYFVPYFCSFSISQRDAWQP